MVIQLTWMHLYMDIMLSLTLETMHNFIELHLLAYIDYAQVHASCDVWFMENANICCMCQILYLYDYMFMPCPMCIYIYVCMYVYMYVRTYVFKQVCTCVLVRMLYVYLHKLWRNSSILMTSLQKHPFLRIMYVHITHNVLSGFWTCSILLWERALQRDLSWAHFIY